MVEDTDSDGNAEESSDSSDDDHDSDDEEGDIQDDSELRTAIEEALRVNGIHAAEDSDDESEEELMDDDQMMAIDVRLAAVFKAHAEERGRGECFCPLLQLR